MTSRQPPRGYVIRVLRLSALASGVLGLCCATGSARRAPASLRGYDILITNKDSLSDRLALALRRRGFTVRRKIRGGGAPTAAVIMFNSKDDEPPETHWLHLRLADTRNGVIVAAVSVPQDSLGPSAESQAQALADSLRNQAVPGRPISPP